MYDNFITMQFGLNKIYQAYIDSIKSRTYTSEVARFLFWGGYGSSFSYPYR